MHITFQKLLSRNCMFTKHLMYKFRQQKMIIMKTVMQGVPEYLIPFENRIN